MSGVDNKGEKRALIFVLIDGDSAKSLFIFDYSPPITFPCQVRPGESC